ncbi:MAG TPA: hypothetical protein VHL57_07850 [Flavobacteriales bacterium]|jgi:hypothetical protein|nr:hypothetical protein [Flavobacteriales bacterium]
MRHFLCTFLFSAALIAHAQDDDLQALNAHFQGTVVFSIDRDDRLIAELSDANGPYRRDMAYLEMLDPATFAYNAEEQVVMVRCSAEHAKCIDKELLKSGAIVPTGRMSLPVPPGDTDGAQALALLGKLVRDEQLALRGEGPGTKRKKSR